MKTLVKVIGKSGQISFGKEYAGRQVLVEEMAPGDWRVRTAVVVPESERWLHTPEMTQSLGRALDWARRKPPEESDLSVVRKAIGHGKGTRRSTSKAGPKQPRVPKAAARAGQKRA